MEQIGLEVKSWSLQLITSAKLASAANRRVYIGGIDPYIPSHRLAASTVGPCILGLLWGSFLPLFLEPSFVLHGIEKKSSLERLLGSPKRIPKLTARAV